MIFFIPQSHLFLLFPFLVLSIGTIDKDYMIKRENETYWKYYYTDINTAASQFVAPFFMDQNSISSAIKKASLLTTLNEYYPDWMSGLSDSRRLDTITMPGTHDTCSMYGGPILICQDLTLSEQLLMGVRLLDIRCRHINDVFMIHHNRIFQRLSFGVGVLEVCVNFLKEHRGEVIFMLIQEEWKPKNNTRTFDETMYKYMNCSEYKDYFYLNEGELPTLKSVRGKIVIFRRFIKEKLSEIDMGNFIKFEVNNDFVSKTTITVYGQDRYKVPTLLDRAKKYEYVESFFEKPKSFEKKFNANTNTTFFFNFGSGQSYVSFPFLVAEYINPRIGKYAEKYYPDEFLGMIFFDFINRYYPKIIFNIIKRNFLPEKNNDLSNNFTVCDTKNCTNKADTTNKLYVVVALLTIFVLVALIIALFMHLVKRCKRSHIKFEKDDLISLLNFPFVVV